MALSSIIRKTCPICGKIAVEKSVLVLGETRLITLECTHVISESALKKSKFKITSSDGRTLMPYQEYAVEFLELAGGRALIADEQGLGKTVEATGFIALHSQELEPTLVVTKTAIKLQFMFEIIRWSGIKQVQAIQSGKEMALPGMKFYVATYDLIKNENMFDMVNLKTIVLDECQAIKDHLSGRAKAVQKIVSKHQIEHVIGLSGTPIKNNAGEYFTILNLIAPKRFPSYQRYLDDYCDYYFNGFGNKVGGLKNPEAFHQVTKDIILRRTKEEVLSDLPELRREFYHVEFSEKLRKAYNQKIKELDDLMYADDMTEQHRNASMIVIMTALRQLTGISKTEACVEFTTDFLLSNTDRKLVIFTHHEIATEKLKADLNKWLREGNFADCLHLHSGLSGDDRQKLIGEFRDGPSRVMIASTLAAGEGLNLQFCSDAIMMERQWNPANEEQAEARFHRFGQKHSVSVTYMIASETIDEYFTELVEQKRAIVASALDNKEVKWDQNSLMKELATVLLSKGKKGWKL